MNSSSGKQNPEVPFVRPQLTQLPFGELQPGLFEDLCERLAGLEPDVVKPPRRYGVSGEKQHGIDVVADLTDGRLLCVQARRTETVTAGKLRDAVADFKEGKFFEETARFVYATRASGQSTGVQDEVRTLTADLAEANVDFDLWDCRDLSRRLEDHPALVERFFGQQVLAAFLPRAAPPVLAQDIAAHLLSDSRFPIGSDGLSSSEIERLVPGILRDPELAPDIRDVIAELRETSNSDAARLISYVQHDPRRARDLVRSPQSWVARGSWQLHEAIGRIATAAAHSSDAEQAFLRAAEFAPHDDRGRLLVAASHSAQADGRPEAAESHLASAEVINAEAPAVRIARIAKLKSSSDRLTALATITATAPRDVKALERATVNTLLADDQVEKAAEALDRMLLHDADSLFARDLRAGLRFWFAASGNVPQSHASLTEAATDSLDIRELMLRRDRFTEAGQLLARAAECFVLAGNPDRAHEVLDLHREEELVSHEVREALAQAYLNTGDHAAALELLPPEDEWTDSTELIAAHVFAASPDHDAHLRAIELASPHLDSETRSPFAGLAMLIAAAKDLDIPWPDRAEEIVARGSVAAAMHFKAERAVVAGNPGHAEQLLLQHSEDDRVLRRLAQLALETDQLPRAKRLAEQLASRTGKAEDRGFYALTLKLTGETERSRTEFRRVATDEGAPAADRSRAFLALFNSIEFEDAASRVELTAEWVRTLDGDPQAHWCHLQTLASLTRYRDAYEFSEQEKLVAKSEDQAELLGYVYLRALPPIEAIRRIAELSDRLDRSSEQLESWVLGHGLSTDLSTAPLLAQRVGESVESFPSRFPNSTAFRTLQLPDEETEIPAYLNTILGPSGDAQKSVDEVLERIRRASAPVAALSQASGKRIPSVMCRLGFVPAAFGHAEEFAQETEVALKAIGDAAVWDPSSLTTVASLPPSLQEALVQSFPGAVLAFPSLHECDAALADAPSDDREQLLLPLGNSYRIVDSAPEALSRERAVTARARELAAGMSPVPAVDPDGPDAFEELISEHRRDSIDTVASTLSVAQRRELPVFSDDRVIRMYARQSQIPAFGTGPLLAAMATRQLLSDDAVATVRLHLLQQGYVGLRPSGTELAQLALEEGSEVGERWTADFYDSTALRNDFAGRLRTYVEFLWRIWQEKPQHLFRYARIIVRAAAAAECGADVIVSRLVLVNLLLIVDLGEDPEARRKFATAVVRAFRQTMHPVEDPLRTALNFLFGEALRSEDNQVRFAVLQRVTRQLQHPLDAQVLVWYLQGDEKSLTAG